jgi:2-polyprenyl-3-methyl-5-hydroxy-6-metoxy-1,4-benzoquinol methylase
MTTFFDLPTIFHITHYKSGSQWVYNVLQAAAPERIMPPRIEVAQFLGQKIIPGMIYPTLYVTREEFESVSLPEKHIKFVTMRDLRDTLVSWYFSAAKSHKESPNLLQVRNELNLETLSDGLRNAIRVQGPLMAAFQLSWMNSDALIVRYEDLLESELLYFRRIIRHCQLPISDSYLEEIVKQFSFNKSSGRKRGSEDTSSHLRKGVRGDWANHLTGQVLDEFKEYFDDVLITTGYEKDRDWGLDLLTKRVPGVDIRKSRGATTSCWCGNSQFQPFSPHYQCCTKCGTLVHVNAIGRRFYDVTEKTAAGEVMQMPNKKINVESIQLWARQLLSRKDIVTKLKICLNYLEPGAKVLEVNAHTGAFVMLLRQAGLDAMGLNPHPLSREFVAFQKEVLQIPMFYGSLKWQNFAENSLDAIILTRIIGEVEDPNELIDYCKKWLKPDGKLIVQDYILRDGRSYVQLQAAGSAALFPLILNWNQFIFTPDSIERLLLESGYAEATTMYLPHPTLTLREKYVDVNMFETCLIASKIPFEYHASAEKALYDVGSGYTLHALMDMYRELALAYQTMEEERELWLEQVDMLTVTTPESILQTNAIRTGLGWHKPEVYQQQRFSWVGRDAELIIHAPSENPFDMYMDLEPGPSVPETGMVLIVSRADGTEVSRFRVVARQRIYLNLPVQVEKTNLYILNVEEGNRPVPNDPRILNYRVFAMGTYIPQHVEPTTTLQGAQDIIAFGSGWYPIEFHGGRNFRWANNNVDILIYNASGRFRKLELDIQSGPSLKHGIFQLDLLDNDDVVVVSEKVRSKGIITFDLPIIAHEDNRFRLRVHSGGLPVPNDPRILNFRVFGVGWAKT